MKFISAAYDDVKSRKLTYKWKISTIPMKPKSIKISILESTIESQHM